MDAQVQSLKKNIRKIKEDIKRIKQRQKGACVEINEKLAEQKKLEKQLKTLMSNICISDHAIVRYLERMEGLDLDLIKDRILPHERESILKALGDCKYSVAGHSLVVRNGIVVTVYPVD